MPRRNSSRWDVPNYGAPAPPAPRPRPGAIRCSDFACAGDDVEKTVHAVAVARVVVRAESGPEVRRREERRPRSAGARAGRDGTRRRKDGKGKDKAKAKPVFDETESARAVRRQMGRRAEVAPAVSKPKVLQTGGEGERREGADVGAGFSALWADRMMGSGSSGVSGRLVRTRASYAWQQVGWNGPGGGSAAERYCRGGVVRMNTLEDIDNWSDATSTVGTESVYEGAFEGGYNGGQVSRCGSRIDAGIFGASFNRSCSECLSEGASGGRSMVVSDESVSVGVSANVSKDSDEDSSDDGGESESTGVGEVGSDESVTDGVSCDESVIEGVIEGLGREDSVIEGVSEGNTDDGFGDFSSNSEIEAPLSIFFHHGTSLSSTQSGRFADADPLTSTPPVSIISSRESEGVGEAFWSAWREERKRRRSSIA